MIYFLTDVRKYGIRALNAWEIYVSVKIRPSLAKLVSTCFHYCWAIESVLIERAQSILTSLYRILELYHRPWLISNKESGQHNGGHVKHLIDYLIIIFIAPPLPSPSFWLYRTPSVRISFLSPAFRCSKKKRWLLQFSPRENWALARPNYAGSTDYTRGPYLKTYAKQQVKSSEVNKILNSHEYLQLR